MADQVGHDGEDGRSEPAMTEGAGDDGVKRVSTGTFTKATATTLP